MIGVLLNPNALGVRRRRDLAGRLRAILADDGLVLETPSADEVGPVVDRFVTLGCDPVGICGGDGTSLSTVTGYMNGRVSGPLPRFALLRGGTVNTVANNVGVRGRPEDLLQRLVARTRAGYALPEVELEAIEVNGRFGFLFAAAMGARFLEAYYRGPKQGVPRAIGLGLRTAVSSLVQGPWARALFEPTPVELTADGYRIPLDRVRVLVASSVQDVGIGMRLMWRAGTETGRFHFIASSISTTSMALQIDRVLGGRPLRGDRHVDGMARALDVRFPAAQVYTLDGELFHDTAVAIRAGPRVRIIRC